MFHIVNVLLATNSKFLPDSGKQLLNCLVPSEVYFCVLVNLVFVWISSSGASKDGEC